MKMKTDSVAMGKRLFSTSLLLCALASEMALAAQNGLVGVSVVKGKDDSQVIKVQFKSEVVGDPVAFTTSNPHRLVLDFADTSSAMGRGVEDVNHAAIRSYQAVQSGERTRLVVNLSAPTAYELRKDKNVIYAVLKNAEAKEAAAPAPALAMAQPKAAEKPVNAGQNIKDVEFRRGKDGEGRVVVTLSDPGVAVDIQQKGKTIQVDFVGAGLPASLQRRLDVSDYATPAQMIETFAQDKSTRMVVTPKGRWDYYAYQAGDQFVIELSDLSKTPEGKEQKNKYSGARMSIDLQKASVRTMIHVIATDLNKNVVMSDTVTGEMALKLANVYVEEALDIILTTNNLGKVEIGNSTFWIAPQKEIAERKEQDAKASASMETLERVVTRSYRLNYIRADDALVIVSGGSRSGVAGSEDATCSPSSTGIKADAASGGGGGSTSTSNSNQGSQSGSGRSTSNINSVLSTRGGGSHDLTTNTLVVTDTPDRHIEVENVLKQIDIPMRQVMIEARIVVADDTFGRDLGAKLGLHSRGGVDGAVIGLSSSGSSARGIATGTAVSSQSGFNVQLPDAAGVANAGTLGLSILNAAANTLLSLELQALEADNRGKIVSNPRVVTTNLKPAVILQGTQIPYQTVSTSGTQTQFKDALLCLLVAPQVLNNDAVILNVEVQKDAQGVATTAGPAINVKRVKTQVRVNNGETAVLGGIFEQTQRNDTTKVPVLGDIPILGNLFKSNSKTDDKSELLIFLTPRLLDDGMGSTK